MSELTAGRELNERVAREVMGLVPCDKWVRANLGSAGGPVSMNHGCEHGGKCYPADPTMIQADYSGHIAAAWLVVEKMREQGFHWFTLNTGRMPVAVERVAPFCNAEFSDEWDTSGSSGDEGTAPLAICRAALKAVDSVRAAHPLEGAK
jgi:hypothetical protein